MTARKFWKGAVRWYDRIISFVLVLVLLIVIYCMYDNLWVYNHTIDKSILKYKPGTENYDPQQSPISNDMVAWITIDNTNIDYPVMQAKDNVKYLNTDPYGKYTLSGSIFLDSRNSSDFSDDYSLVYGHHMEYGKMFGALDDFLDEKYLKKHSTGTLIIGREGKTSCKLKIFAALKVNANETAVFDIAVGGVKEYLTKAIKASPEQGKRILALSTCSEDSTPQRIVVFCYIND